MPMLPISVYLSKTPDYGNGNLGNWSYLDLFVAEWISSQVV